VCVCEYIHFYMTEKTDSEVCATSNEDILVLQEYDNKRHWYTTSDLMKSDKGSIYALRWAGSFPTVGNFSHMKVGGALMTWPTMKTITICDSDISELILDTKNLETLIVSWDQKRYCIKFSSDDTAVKYREVLLVHPSNTYTINRDCIERIECIHKQHSLKVRVVELVIQCTELGLKVIERYP